MSTRVWWTWCSVAVAVATTVATTGCADDPATQVEGASIERTATSTTTVAATTTTGPTTTIAVGMLPPEMVERSTDGPRRDWEGQRYDFGTIRQALMESTGRSISFDRKQLRGEDGELASGPTFTEEPIVVTDGEQDIVNTSRSLRTFTVASDVRVRQLDPAWTCDPGGPAAPAWNDIPYESLVIFGIGDDDVDSLVFDDAGHVVQIRLSRAC